MSKEKVSIFWFRRDLRLDDNYGLFKALKGESPVLPIFIFDDDITDELVVDDSRITFIYDQLSNLSVELKQNESSIYCLKGSTIDVWKKLLTEFDIDAVYTNEDYEPYAILRDKNVAELLTQNGVKFELFKDQVIFAKDDILKGDKTPYTVFTPYKNKWLEAFKATELPNYTPIDKANFLKTTLPFPSITDLGFERSTIEVIDFNLNDLRDYEEERNFPALNKTSYLSPHLRFGTVSVRQVIRETENNLSFLTEIIWREFFMQIIYCV